MSKEDWISSGILWMGDLYQKTVDMYHEVDDILSQRVSESLRQASSSANTDLPVPASPRTPATCEEKADFQGQNPVTKSDISSKATDKECLKSPEDIVKQSIEELKSKVADLILNVKKSYLSNENSEKDVEDALKEKKLTSSKVLESTSWSDEHNATGNKPLNESTDDVAQKINDEIEEEILSLSEGEPLLQSSSIDEDKEVEFPISSFGTSEVTCCDVKDSGESSSVNCSIINEENQDSREEKRLSFASCESELIDQEEASPSGSSPLVESVDELELSHSDLPLHQKEGNISQDSVHSNSGVISFCSILPSSGSLSPYQVSETYSSDRSLSSSTCTLPFDIFGQSNASSESSEEMETIDLRDKVKLDASCVIVENDTNLSNSSRRGRFRSYKKIMGNAFGSKKRLEKEYKQLALRYGDIDTDFSELTHNRRPLSLTVQYDLKNSMVQDVDDNDWEIL